jgi:cation diffusion facilitator CzcD-associated flavoprotein CzcO
MVDSFYWQVTVKSTRTSNVAAVSVAQGVLSRSFMPNIQIWDFRVILHPQLARPELNFGF